MRKKLLLPAVLAAFCLLSSCTHYYYAPNTLQAPFLQNQHDTKVNMGLIGGDEFNGWEANALYSPVKYTAVMLNHFQVQHGRRSFEDNEDWGEGRLTEFAVGAYLPANEINCFSLFAGVGAGRVLNIYEYDGRADLRFRRWFVQPSFSAQGDWARFGLSFRLNRLEYTKGNITYDIGENHLRTIKNIEETTPIFVPEAGLSFGFGSRPVWFNFGFNFNLMPDKRDYGFAGTTASLGLQFDLDYLWR